MDEHAQRITRHFLGAIDRFRAGEATLLDLSRNAGQTAASLDNASAPLPKLLLRAESDLEYAYFATESEEHASEAERILAPILIAIEENG